MKKWFMAFAALMLVVSLCAVPTGCGPGKATDLEKKEVVHPEGHEAQVETERKQIESGVDPTGSGTTGG